MPLKVVGSNPTGRVCNCKTNWVYAITKNNKVRRLTFSYSLAKFIHSKNQDHKIKLLDLYPCGEAKEDDACIFGIVDKKSGMILRAAVSWEEAVFLTQDNSRRIKKCLVKEVRDCE